MEVRYSRQGVIPQIGESGQEKLSRGRVLVVGAGGLGSPVIAYLAAAGVGHITIADGDCVELSNLNRQILHSTETIGVPKAPNAQAFARRLNPEIEVVALHQRVDAGFDVRPYEVVVDCTDNFEARFVLNKLCQEAEIPFVHGAIAQFMGQATTFLPGGPCYRCLVPKIPKVPSPAVTGVVGAVAGTMGTIQAVEVIKILLGSEDLLRGRLIVYDGWRMTFTEIAIPQKPHCPDCGSVEKGA